jgi:hypothetical protein
VAWDGGRPDGGAVLARAMQGASGRPIEFGVAGWRVKVEREGTK